MQPGPIDGGGIPLDAVQRECNEQRPAVAFDGKHTLIDCDVDLKEPSDPDAPADWLCFRESDHPKPGLILRLWRGPDDGLGVSWSFSDDPADERVATFRLQGDNTQLIASGDKQGFLRWPEPVPSGQVWFIAQLIRYQLDDFESLAIDPKTHQVKVSSWGDEKIALYLNIFDDPPIYVESNFLTSQGGEIRFSEPLDNDLARLFHIEGSHAKIYAKNDWAFTPVFNVTVPDYDPPLLPPLLGDECDAAGPLELGSRVATPAA